MEKENLASEIVVLNQIAEDRDRQTEEKEAMIMELTTQCQNLIKSLNEREAEVRRGERIIEGHEKSLR